jgi:DNA-binding FrmR family transcriptional regulator
MIVNSPTPRQALANRLARVEGQLRAVQKQLTQDNGLDDCEQIAQQMAAARKALDKAFFMMLGCALEHKGQSASSPAAIGRQFKLIGDLLAKYS